MTDIKPVAWWVTYSDGAGFEWSEPIPNTYLSKEPYYEISGFVGSGATRLRRIADELEAGK